MNNPTQQTSMKPYRSLAPDRVKTILEAQAAWKEWADREKTRGEKEHSSAIHHSAVTGYSVVRSYDLELQTGKPHCPCCLKPLDTQR